MKVISKSYEADYTMLLLGRVNQLCNIEIGERAIYNPRANQFPMADSFDPRYDWFTSRIRLQPPSPCSPLGVHVDSNDIRGYNGAMLAQPACFIGFRPHEKNMRQRLNGSTTIQAGKSLTRGIFRSERQQSAPCS